MDSTSDPHIRSSQAAGAFSPTLSLADHDDDYGHIYQNSLSGFMDVKQQDGFAEDEMPFLIRETPPVSPRQQDDGVDSNEINSLHGIHASMIGRDNMYRHLVDALVAIRTRLDNVYNQIMALLSRKRSRSEERVVPIPSTRGDSFMQDSESTAEPAPKYARCELGGV